nr:MAG TPA: hypothetical protein [Bacteriophage sp.]
MPDRKITAMHRVYGQDDAHKCADCSNLCIYVTSSHTLYKCMAYGVSASAATDWAKRWTACGLYEKTLAIDCVPLIKRLTRMKKQEEPLDGQMTFLGTEEES